MEVIARELKWDSSLPYDFFWGGTNSVGVCCKRIKTCALTNFWQKNLAIAKDVN